MKRRSLLCLVFLFGLADCTGYSDLSTPIQMPATGYVLSEDGLRLAYRIVGDGPKTVVVPLIHWNVDAFGSIAGDDFRFVFYDPQNRGGSDGSPDPTRVTLRSDLRDLDTVIRWTRAKKVSLIGTSYYGGLVARYAMEKPQNVDRVVMVGALPLESSTLFSYAPPERAVRVPEEERKALEARRAGGLESKDPVEYCRQYWALESRLSVARAEAGGLIADRCDFPNEWPRNITWWAKSIFDSLGSWNWTFEASTLRAPVLLLHGTGDLRVPPESSKQWRDRLPHGELLMIEGAGHSPWWDAPETIFPAVGAFLRGGSLGGA